MKPAVGNLNFPNMPAEGLWTGISISLRNRLTDYKRSTA